MSKLDRRGIERLLAAGWTKVELSPHFQVSRQTLIRWMQGAEPRHEAVTEFINQRVARLLAQL